ncbi:MAG: hypothetical protein RRB13_06730 [bacterium]|nr:hypothetical protein [bacterium]
MYFSKFKSLWVALGLFALVGCKDIADDLNPSATDQRDQTQVNAQGETEQSGTNLNLTLYDTSGNAVQLSDLVAQHPATVFYFTMWCPICASHQDHLSNHTKAMYPTAGYYLIDYVSGSSAATARELVESGFASSGLTALADVNQAAVGEFNGTMGITLVFDQAGVLHLNEDFKDGTRTEAALANILN